MTNPGDQVPAGDDYVVRRLDDLQRQINELGPSVAASFNSTVATLRTLAQTNAANTYGMAVPSSGATYTTTLTVPPGMSQCAYVMLVYGNAINSTGGNSFLVVTVNAPGSAVASSPAASGASAYANTGITGAMSGLVSGQVVNFTATISATLSWAANAGNGFHIQVMGLFMP